MKIEDLIEIGKQASKKEFWLSDDFVEEFDLYSYDLNMSKNDKLYSVDIGVWICTDTWVGHRLYFLEGEFICYSYQPARKSDEIMYWKSKDIFSKVKLYLESIKIVEDKEINILEEDYNFKDGFSVNYYSQLLTKEGVYNNQNVKIVGGVTDRDAPFDNLRRYLPSLAKIKYESGEEEIVDVGEIILPYKCY